MNKRQRKKRDKKAYKAAELRRKKEWTFITLLRKLPPAELYAIEEVMIAFINDNLPVKEAEAFVQRKIEEYNNNNQICEAV